ncbi:MAG: DNA primase, partial [Bacteroidaceae bacterium]|nr:DNA primase [Bacteroidaceae bacterium]
MIDQLTIEKIRDAARIEEVVADFVTLKRAGVNLKGLCPFHDDRTPSFIVSPAKNYCKCFACGEGGNPVTFIMKHENVSYVEALRYLAKKYGIEIEERSLTPEETQRNDDRESMFILNEWANKWFQHQLRDTADGQAIGLSYFHGRGFRDDILEKFQVGYCPNSRSNPMTADALAAGYQERFLTNTPNEQDTRQSVGTGLSFKNAKGELRDRFFGRVMWPIFTISGRVAGFGGRVLDAATKGVNIKYQNSPESIVYSKRHELYGLYQAKQAISKNDSCYLVEGYTDVMAMHQAGVENVVASSGTALTDEQIRLIHRLTNNIVVIYDGDAAGIKASQRGIDMLLRQGMNVRLLLLPDGDDPDSFSRKHSAEDFQKYLKENQVDFIKFKTNLLMEEAKGDPVA